MGLQQFERRLERLVEGAFAKAFRGELQPVEIARRLTREMDLRRTVSARGLIAPNAFEVLVSRANWERFGSFVDVLAQELADTARDHAKAERYILVGPVEVRVVCADQLPTNRFAISSQVREGDEFRTSWVVLPDGRRVAIAAEAVTIGRLPECAIVLRDANVSRRHAQIRLEEDGVVLRDLGSTNGTRVNDVPVRERRLRNGDRISVGNTTMVLETG
jgi:hypothetical protein